MNRLYRRCLELGIVFPPGVPQGYDSARHHFSTLYLHEQMRKIPANRALVPDDESWERENIFYRRYTSNPKSPYYIDLSDLNPTAAEVIAAIRGCGGKAFAAHIYQYGEQAEALLKALVEDCGIDGIECRYPTFTQAQTERLLKLCAENGLLVSGGSDYHGASRPEARIGSAGVGEFNI
jgi:hypothetical protein